MDTPIVANATPKRKPQLNYFRIHPIILYPNDNTVFIADGVIMVDGCPWFGQVRGTDSAFRVAPYVDGDGDGWMAGEDWQTARVAASTLNTQDSAQAQAA